MCAVAMTSTAVVAARSGDAGWNAGPRVEGANPTSLAPEDEAETNAGINCFSGYWTCRGTDITFSYASKPSCFNVTGSPNTDGRTFMICEALNFCEWRRR